jgi:hypothetical protein
MHEIWLRSNRRVITAAALPPLVGAIVCFVIAAGYVSWIDAGVLRILFGIMGGICLLSLAIYASLAWQPRLAYAEGHLLVYLGLARPTAVPIEVVEAFLLGQGPSWLAGKKHQRTETTTLVIRLAERATEWKHRPVYPMLGSWCDGYITIRGTWCEPLSVEVAKRLNLRLHELTRARKNDETVGQRA